jgi:hypothetical protein
MAWVVCLSLLLSLQLAHGFYLPGVAPQDFKKKDPVMLKVNKLSSVKTQLPYEYYSLPYCRPDKITSFAENLGEVLRGDRIENSLYQFYMRTDEQCKVLCRIESLSAVQSKAFKEKIADDYKVNMILDNLPVAMVKILKDEDGKQMKSYERGYYVGFKATLEGQKVHMFALAAGVDGSWQCVWRQMAGVGGQQWYSPAAAHGDAFQCVKSDTPFGHRTLFCVAACGGLCNSLLTRCAPACVCALQDVKFFLHNHLRFNILYNRDAATDLSRVVGFEAEAFSVKHDYDKPWDSKSPTLKTCNPGSMVAVSHSLPPQSVDEGSEVIFTYDVKWSVSLEHPRGQEGFTRMALQPAVA